MVGDSGLGDDSPRNDMFRKCSFHFPTWITRDMATTQFLIVGVFVDAPARAIPMRSMILALAGQEDLACEWMRSEMGEFLEDFFTALPGQLERTLGRRVEDLRPRWANGTSQLVARMLAKHIDDFANRDISMSLPR